MYVKFNVYVGLLVLLFESTTSATEAPNNTVYSTELSNEITPCRSRVLPCVNGAYRCSSQDEYYRLFGTQLGCPSVYNSTATPPPATTCTLANNTCAFVEGAPTCVSWLRDCNIEYSCTTEADFSAATENDETACSFPASPPPTPNAICIPVNDTCEWHNPCRTWQNWCGGEYRCGSEAQYAAFINGPQPICAFPPFNATSPVPAGECVYQDGQCVWSECTAWLSPCQTSWECGSNYEYRVSQAQPLPACPYPGEDFVPPPMPGICAYDLQSEQCQFQPNCTGGLEYQSCGTACPRTCDNYQLDFVACILVCVPGCFCPDGTVLHEGECISPSLCPGENPCNLIDCHEGYECLIYEETGEGYCSPNCEDLNPCGPQEQCVITAVNCVRAPCPGVLSCEGRCVGGKEWQECGTACPLTCDNYDTPLPCTEQCVEGCFCPEGTVLHEEECVAISDCPNYITPCALILCPAGHTCEVQGANAYCEPSCEPSSNLCGEGEICELLDQDCIGYDPCPHTYQCLPQETCKAWRQPCFNQTWVCSSYEDYLSSQLLPQPLCPVLETSLLVPHPGQCVLSGGTCQFRANCTGGKKWQECGTACPLTCDNYDTPLACTEQCVEGCFCPEGKVELDGACVEPSMCSVCNTCEYGEVCSVVSDFDVYYYPICKGPTAGYCSYEIASACASNNRCLKHNITGINICLESCYIQNGGCSDDQVCYYERVDEECNPLLESCFKTACTDTSSGDCPIGWEHSGCASACPTTCEDYLQPQLKVCADVCGSCECPQGMVVFRDRCVDPLECYTLMTEPSLNPLPQPEDVLLIRMSLVGVSQETFDKYKFARAVEMVLDELGFDTLYVSVYAVYMEDGNTVIVLKLQGETVIRDGTDIVAELINNREQLGSEVAAVSTVNIPNVSPSPSPSPSGDDYVSSAVVAGSIVAVVAVCSLLMLALVIVVTLYVRSLRMKRTLEVTVNEKEKPSDNLSFINLVSKEADKDYHMS